MMAVDLRSRAPTVRGTAEGGAPLLSMRLPRPRAATASVSRGVEKTALHTTAWAGPSPSVLAK